MRHICEACGDEFEIGGDGGLLVALCPVHWREWQDAIMALRLEPKEQVAD